jgi:rubrerythrin
MKRWTLDDIPWDRFDAARVDPSLVAVAKTASLVERNAADYAAYLRSVFADDPEFSEAARYWADEETQHGLALGRWAKLADPAFDFDDALRRFVAGYRIPIAATASVRGSRSGELIARCVVESGTSSFYSAVRDSTEEPVIKAISHRIAGDEFRHYKLFYDYLQRYLSRERLWRLQRVRVASGRLLEIDDDELSFAYHCANRPESEPYDRKAANIAYTHIASQFYRRSHVERAASMMLKACGLSPDGWLGKMARGVAWLHVQRHQRRPLPA